MGPRRNGDAKEAEAEDRSDAEGEERGLTRARVRREKTTAASVGGRENGVRRGEQVEGEAHGFSTLATGSQGGFRREERGAPPRVGMSITAK